MKLELSPEDLVSSEWSVPCPRCRAENLIKAGHYSHKFIVCQGCAHFMGISATGTSVEVSHGGRSPRLMLQSGLLYFILGSSLATALYAGHRWGVMVGVGTFILWFIIGILATVTYASLGKR
jgi:hypothetical protein